MKLLKLAILDLYDNTPNQGMRCIKEIVRLFDSEYHWDVFDVRGKAEVPDLSYDIYISTGGPGSPHEGDGVWDVKYFQWLSNVWEWNRSGTSPAKHVFFICHSFQMACKFFEIGSVIKRNSQSFGTFPVHLTEAGRKDPLFLELDSPFYVADFRDYQVVQPNAKQLETLGATIICREKIRPHIPLERAIMGVRFSNEIIGVQFHPEADPAGMLLHFTDSQRQNMVIENHGVEKLEEMISHLNDEDKIRKTHNTVLPTFLRNALTSLLTPVAV